MTPVDIALALLVALFGSGGIWAIFRIRHESVDNWADIAAKLRVELAGLDEELHLQRRHRHELEEEVRGLEHRIERLEFWIVNTTGTDPATING